MTQHADFIVPLLQAIQNDSLFDVERTLAESSPDRITGWTDNFGNTVMHHAALNSDNPIEYPKTYAAPIIRLLARAGIDIDTGNIARQTPLHIAVMKRSYAAIDALLELGADMHAKNFMDETPEALGLQDELIRTRFERCKTERAQKIEAARLQKLARESAIKAQHLARLDRLDAITSPRRNLKAAP